MPSTSSLEVPVRRLSRNRAERTCEGCGKPLPLFARGQRRYCDPCGSPAARKARSNGKKQPELYTEWDSDKPRPHSDEWLDVHGIKRPVWEARGVRPYSWEDLEDVKDAFRPFLPNTRLGTVTRIVNQSSGLLMPKHAPPGRAPIPPQSRPDYPVILDRGKWHSHGIPGGVWPVFPPEAGKAAGKALPRKLIVPEASLDGHIGRAKGPKYDPATGIGDHHGEDIKGVHYHAPESAKYVLLGPDGGNARIDLHPWALDLLPEAERVFFGIEGALKNDAMLSAGEATASIAAVGMWDPDELRWFAKTYLQGKRVYVVPDADWYFNPAVARQALYVRETIRSQGVQSFIAAPPVEDGQEPCKCPRPKIDQDGRYCLCGGFLKGVDDFLGAGGVIDGLVVRDREAPLGVITEWAYGRPYSIQLRRSLTGLSLHADDNGEISVPAGTLVRITETHRKDRLVGRLDRLAVAGAIEIHGSLELVTTERPRILKGGQKIKGQKVRVVEWKDQPTIVVHREFRAIEPPTIPTIAEFEIQRSLRMSKR